MNILKQIKNKEEKWNVLTHAAGILFALIAFPFLLIKSTQSEITSQIISSVIYASSFLLLFSSSTIYHFVQLQSAKLKWRKIDHISIYFMISGTYVPFMMAYLKFSNAIIFLSIMYILVLLGTIFKVFYTGKFEKLSLFLYIFLGWMVIFMAKSFFGNAPIIVSTLVILGGLAYMVGVYFYTRDQKKYFHAIWHIFVLLGSIFHFLAVYFI